MILWLTKYVVKVSNKFKLAIEKYRLYQKYLWNTLGGGEIVITRDNLEISLRIAE